MLRAVGVEKVESADTDQVVSEDNKIIEWYADNETKASNKKP